MSQTILGFDEGAGRKLAEMREAGRFTDCALRVSVQEEGAAFRYQIEVVKQDEREQEELFGRLIAAAEAFCVG